MTLMEIRYSSHKLFTMSSIPVSNMAMISLLIFLLSSSEIFVTSSQEDGVSSNLLDIHLEMQSGGSINIKSAIRDEIKTFLKNCKDGINQSIVESPEEKSPIAARSIDDQEKYKLDSKLNTLSTQLQTFEKLLQKLEDSQRTTYRNGNMCLKGTKPLGVQYYECTETVKKSNYPKNCKEVLQSGNNATGIYEIYPRNAKASFSVLCDMETRGGGWTHIQKRFDGSQDFYLEWRDYKFGFGDLKGEFWLGLENIFLLTGGLPSELFVEIVDRDNVTAYAHYSSFEVGPEKNGYTLSRLSGFSGDAGDSLNHHLGAKFSTKDLDFTTENCATLYLGGWWYKACHISNLNGKFINVDLPDKLKYKGMHWKTFRNHEYCHAKARMLVRPTD